MSRRSAVRVTTGLALGGALAIVELGFILLSVPALVFPAARSAVFARAKAVTELERRRLDRYLFSHHLMDYSGQRAWRYLAVRWVVGVLGVSVFLLIASGAVGGAVMAWQMASGHQLGGDGPLSWYDPVLFVLVGALMIFLTVQGLIGVAALDRQLAKHFLSPGGEEILRRRILELSVSRAEVVAAVNGERRRIERDLHDGVQQRLVALGILLGRARRTADEQHADDLLRQAHDESLHALEDLRAVTWQVYPIALEQAGLRAALESLIERAIVPTRLVYGLEEQLDIAMETVIYFTVSEAVTNATKHADATMIDIVIAKEGNTIVASVMDNGSGGATMSGGGLSGLASRVAAADGEFTVDSPEGGPTVVTAELPCG